MTIKKYIIDLEDIFQKRKIHQFLKKTVVNETDNSIDKNAESIDEKMKIMPVSNNELDCVKDKFYKKLKNPLFKDIKDGMTVVIENADIKDMFIVIDYENLPEFFT